MANKDLRYFMREEAKVEQIVTVPGPESIKDENGKVIQLEIKQLHNDTIAKINEMYESKTPLKDKKGNFIVQNGNVVYRTHSATFYCEPTVAAGDYVRLQARKDNEVIVLVNPVHAMEIQPKHCFFQDVLAEFQKVDHTVFQPLQKNIAIK